MGVAANQLFSSRALMATETSSPRNSHNLLAAVDMGTNSFKMLIVRAEPNGRFLAIDRYKEPVVLGQGMLGNAPAITPEAQDRAIAALQKFGQVLQSKRIDRAKFVATSAVREAVNRGEFLTKITEEVGSEIEVLSGEEEARLVYLGVLQFLPVYDRTVLTVDIGGGSTEFVIGKKGKVKYAVSLKLGHVSLTDAFVRKGEISKMREHIRAVINGSGLVEKVKEIGFETAVGSSGTIRAIQRAVNSGYAQDLMNSVASADDFGRKWGFSREELSGIVKKLCDSEAGGVEELRRVGFFKRRSEFIVAGAVLLLEIFEILKIDEMEVSGYALGEGVIAKTLVGSCESYDIGANPRWRSVVHLAERFNNEKKMNLAARCATTAKELFVCLKRCQEFFDHQSDYISTLSDKDLECLQAACLLHNIGQFVGRKGYHKQSYHIIRNGDYLHSYTAEEVKLIALLTRHHRKKFPKLDQSRFHGSSDEMKRKFRILCAIIRISVAVHQCQNIIFRGFEISDHENGLLLIFSGTTDHLPGQIQLPTVLDVKEELRMELDHFEEVLQMKLSIVLDSHL